MSPADTLKPYIGWAGCASEGAVLVFAHDTRQAKRLAFDTLRGWFDAGYIDVRVRRLREHADWLQRLANPEALAAGRAHAVDDPASCARCETWGTPLLEAGICIRCDEATRADAVEVH
jgi:hypothetical protein